MQGRINLTGVLAVVGAVVLVVGLSLSWYEPGITAWTAFELVDLLLAAIAVGVVVVVLGRSPRRPRLEALAAWIPVAALAALVLIVAALVNPPPAAIDRSLEVGAWVSLGGALLLLAAALLATTELSVVVTARPRSPDRGRPARRTEQPPAADEPAWEAPDNGFEEPPTDEGPIEDAHDEAIEDFHGEGTEPVDEGVVPDDDFALEEETRPLPRQRAR